LRSPLWREVLITLAIALVVYLGINLSLQNAEVLGQSMEPDLHNGERVFINKLAYRFGSTPHRGDIIVFVPPEELTSPNDYVKRIIGLPGERVEVRNGHVYIHKPDGTELLLEEPYVTQPILGYYMSDVIPEGHYFVMGDNRNNSGDSRGGWTVPLSDIVGRAWLVIWPPSEWGAAPNYRLPALAGL
jgi:signal peptidase I